MTVRFVHATRQIIYDEYYAHSVSELLKHYHSIIMAEIFDSDF